MQKLKKYNFYYFQNKAIIISFSELNEGIIDNQKQKDVKKYVI